MDGVSSASTGRCELAPHCCVGMVQRLLPATVTLLHAISASLVLRFTLLCTLVKKERENSAFIVIDSSDGVNVYLPRIRVFIRSVNVYNHPLVGENHVLSVWSQKYSHTRKVR